MKRRRHAVRPGAPATKAVFVDQSGRRRRLLTVIGAGLAAALLAGLGVLGVGLMTGGNVPLPGWPDSARADEGRPAPSGTPVTEVTSAPAQQVQLTSPVASASPTPNNPGQGDQHRNTARPSKTPGKPG